MLERFGGNAAPAGRAFQKSQLNKVGFMNGVLFLKSLLPRVL